MSIFPKILVGLDLTDMDQSLLDYLDFFKAGSPPPTVHYLHVSYAMQLPTMVGGRYTREMPDPGLNDQLKAELLAELQNRIGEEEAVVSVIEGTISRQMLDYMERKQLNLAIVGKKKVSLGSGVAAKRLLRGTHASVLFVTEDPPKTLDHIMVAVDFTPYSEHGMRKALALAKAQPTPPRITMVNVYDVPTDQAFRISRTEGQYARIIRENVESIVPEYLARFDTDGLELGVRLQENTHYNAAKHLYELAGEVSPSLVVMGARGHSTLTALLLGSVTERFLSYNTRFPTLIVRE
ncbi:MAG: hypothetical protein D6722_04255 [Bacteroidetes bacterium]|nr:MAG: hypothetical protein D6722_04255 [Bacteroidota bacterium]